MAYHEIDLNRALKVVIYNRCSTEELNQVDALERQVAYSRDYCVKRNWEVLHQYVESKSGTSTEHRYEYRKLFASLSTLEYDLVVVKSQDRLMRSDLEWNLFIRELLRTGKRLFFYIDSKLYNHEQDHMVYSMISKFNEFQSVLLSEKIRDAHAKRQEFKTGVNICREMFGWDKIAANVYRINDKEAAAIREAFELVREGMGFYRLAGYMYGKGYRSKGTSGTRSLEPGMISAAWWRKDCIYNPRMHGTVVMNKDTMNFWTKKREKNPKEEWIYYENALPAIVSREYQEETIALLESRRYRPAGCNRMLAGRHGYSNKLFCEACGSFYYRSKIKSGGGELINWKCAKQMQLGHEKCNNIIIEETELDRLLEKYAGQKFEELFTKDAGIAAKTVKWIGLALRDNSVEKLREDWTVELRRQKKKKDVLFAKLMEGTISDEDFKTYHRKQEQEIQSLQEKLDAIADETESGEKLREKLEKIQSRLQDGAVERKAVMLRLKSSIRRMTVKPSGRVTVFFEEEKLRDLLELYQMPEEGKENLFTMEFDYHREKKTEKKRRETNRKILEIFAANPQMTVADCAKALEMSYSYVYTSVAQLRKMGKLEEKNRRCRNACVGGQDAEETEGEKSF